MHRAVRIGVVVGALGLLAGCPQAPTPSDAGADGGADAAADADIAADAEADARPDGGDA